MEGKLNIIIDARMVNEQLHGIARYTYELIKNMSLEKDIHIIVLVNDLYLANKLFEGLSNIEFIKMKSKFLSLREQIELPLIVNKYKGRAIFHSPSFVSSPFIKCKMIMTIHDLNHLRFPQYYTPFHKYYYRYIVKPSALKCEKILTVSEFSKTEIIDWLRCDSDKVVVTYNGVDEKFKVIEDVVELNRVRKKYNLPDKFVLYIGNLKPHKNVETLVKAMGLTNENIKLIINGKPNESLNNLIKELKLEDRVQFIGYVEDNDLPILYNLATVFVFPSLYEGFGLPPLEAMACGCPVIAANTSSLTEIVNNYGILAQALDINQFKSEISYYFENNVTKFNEYTTNIIGYSSSFKWKNTCDKTLEVIRQIYC
ncbi:glycosyltransferase family 1 protein [Clostridium sp. A1-XYC3]|uniref:Glycosyltransferase family 1 protein n=1 Tax=Clostridium tanneri TaxID=3037988 RepID=A0ABU4JWR5_9CLOT|nr:glycosyltransferase family 1 protein [Clostridium sp. A1-XYC3]MDW8802595.1 glycosyltransferase family 1 protein [Clostridium sp. A1-XYC3]